MVHSMSQIQHTHEHTQGDRDYFQNRTSANYLLRMLEITIPRTVLELPYFTATIFVDGQTLRMCEFYVLGVNLTTS